MLGLDQYSSDSILREISFLALLSHIDVNIHRKFSTGLLRVLYRSCLVIVEIQGDLLKVFLPNAQIAFFSWGSNIQSTQLNRLYSGSNTPSRWLLKLSMAIFQSPYLSRTVGEMKTLLQCSKSQVEWTHRETLFQVIRVKSDGGILVN